MGIDSLVLLQGTEGNRFRGLRAHWWATHVVHSTLIASPNDALGADIVDASNLVDGEDVVEAFDVAQDGRALPAEDPTRRPKIRAQFGRRRTHNEQLIVAPCGMIIAREFFFSSRRRHT